MGMGRDLAGDRGLSMGMGTGEESGWGQGSLDGHGEESGRGLKNILIHNSTKLVIIVP